MPYNFFVDSFHIKRCSRLSSSECYFRRKMAVLRFWASFGAWGEYARTMITWKRVVDFLLVLTELLSLGVTAEALRAIIGSKSAISLQRGSVDPKFQVEGVAPTNHSSSQKTRLNDLSYKNLDRSFFRFVTMDAFYGRTDGQADRILIARPRLHSMQRGKKTNKWRNQSIN